MLQMWKAGALLFSLNNMLLLSIPKLKKKTTNKQTKKPLNLKIKLRKLISFIFMFLKELNFAG